ncbi:MAG TPA: glycosyltransferase [Tepidisphaeraceae bacterium]|jgi:glycosyltransferase involved in cell wall biosynthesis|nr:glycosyltransferase [Tepidisphaeraceae bacterium]
MKVLCLHNHYQQKGGEDQSFAAEVAMLRANGVEVIEYRVHNDEVKQLGTIRVAGKTFWNSTSYRAITELCRQHRPDVAHFTNTFPLISPAGYYAAKASGVAVVQSLRNFRLMCVNALFFRDGHVCEDCLGRTVAWPGVLHKCYRDSRAGSAVVAAMTAAHRFADTWHDQVDLFYSLTEFGRQKYIQGGFPGERIVVKPNFVYPDPGMGTGDGNYAIFVTRLSPEKGVHTILKAWETLGARLPLKVVGDGPLLPLVQAARERGLNVEALGSKPLAETYDLIGRATVLVFPSEWYETFGRVAIEAYAKGTPVVAADIGAIAEVVDDGRTGLRFRPGDATDLVAKVNDLLDAPQRLASMRDVVRREFETCYSAEQNLHLLLDVYARAIAYSASRQSA